MPSSQVQLSPTAVLAAEEKILIHLEGEAPEKKSPVPAEVVLLVMVVAGDVKC